MIATKCPECGYSFDLNAPGVSTDEQPYFTFAPDDGRTVYVCSSVCLESYLKTREHTEPRGPNPPSY
jgi:hypothetical protein